MHTFRSRSADDKIHFEKAIAIKSTIRRAITITQLSMMTLRRAKYALPGARDKVDQKAVSMTHRVSVVRRYHVRIHDQNLLAAFDCRNIQAPGRGFGNTNDE